MIFNSCIKCKALKKNKVTKTLWSSCFNFRKCLPTVLFNRFVGIETHRKRSLPVIVFRKVSLDCSICWAANYPWPSSPLSTHCCNATGSFLDRQCSPAMSSKQMWPQWIPHSNKPFNQRAHEGFLPWRRAVWSKQNGNW